MCRCADVQRGDGSGFALETVGKVFGGSLDRDLAAEPRIQSPVYPPHAACAERPFDPVRP
jgi:hypothetical protein